MSSLLTIAKTEQKAQEAAQLLWQLLREKRQMTYNTDLLSDITNNSAQTTNQLAARQLLLQQDRLLELHNDLVNQIILYREGAPYRTLTDLQERLTDFRNMHAAVRATYTPLFNQHTATPYQAA